jgi:hypothetical protein
MTKKPPPGTPSVDAMDLFERHFHDLSILRREMIEFRCAQYCEGGLASGKLKSLVKGYVDEVMGVIRAFNKTTNGSIIEVNSFQDYEGVAAASGGSNQMISTDPGQQAVLVQWVWRVPDTFQAEAEKFVDQLRGRLEKIEKLTADKLSIKLTGLVTLDHALTTTLIKEIPVHEAATIWLPFLILALALRSFRLLLLALIPMPIEILVSFGIMYYVSEHTLVLFYAIMMMLMMCTSLSFDYALFSLTRYSEERAHAAGVEEAIVTVISQSGRVILVSGVVLMVGWGAMLGLPSPFDTFCVAANSMILICVLVQLTFTPSLLAILPFLGPPATLPEPVGPVGGGKKNGGRDLESEATPLTIRDRTYSGYNASALEKAAPFRKGFAYTLGKYLTQCPFNVIIPILIYIAMSPLTMRMLKNFDVAELKFKMGHSYQMNVPRDSEEWITATRILKNFPAVAGVMMPLLIIATEADPEDVNNLYNFGTTTTPPPATTALTIPPSLAASLSTLPPLATTTTPSLATTFNNVSALRADTKTAGATEGAEATISAPGATGTAAKNASEETFSPLTRRLQPATTLTQPAATTLTQPAATTLTQPAANTLAPAVDQTPLNVENQKFFEMSCQMVKTVKQRTVGTDHMLNISQFVSPSYNPVDGSCNEADLLNLVRSSPTVRFFTSDVSDAVAEMWRQLVSKNKDAMLTFVFPQMDPFCPAAFNLVNTVRAVLREETKKNKESRKSPTDRITTFMTFSPGSILMDLIDITSEALPKSFCACLVICMLLAAIWFGCVLIPFKMLLNISFQITWTYGAALYVYEDGYLDWTGFPGVMRTGDSGLDWTVPVFTLTFILGLAMDYEIFLIERVLEFRHEGFGDKESIQVGLAATATTITCAGLIMVFTFFAQLLGTIPVTNQMGFVLVFAILVDTFIVRTILVPAVLSLGACANYWPTRMPTARYHWLGTACCGFDNDDDEQSRRLKKVEESEDEYDIDSDYDDEISDDSGTSSRRSRNRR